MLHSCRTQAIRCFGDGLVSRSDCDIVRGRRWAKERNTPAHAKPFQKPHPPIWFGGSHPNALRRAVRYADGFFGAGSQTTAQFADQVKVVREALSEQKRDPGTFPIAKRVYIAVDDSTTRARERITAALDEQYGYFSIKGLGPVAVAGPPNACVQGLREVFDAGADMILLNPLFDDLQQMERLAAEVMPRLSA